MLPRYPIYVVSRGRADNCKTARFLAADGVPFHIAVHPEEVEAYAANYGRDKVLMREPSDLTSGSIPGRNWIWEHARAAGHARHWILDDNIRGILRRFEGTKIGCNSGDALAITENFVDRYENIAIAGLNCITFIHDGAKHPPFNLNGRVYSCMLIRNDLPYRWRGRYNEDTDLCLQVLANGWCTVLMNAFLIEKVATMTMKGGNAANLYKGDGRLKMARALERQWPHVVRVDRRFHRPQHVVDWSRFDTPLKRRADVDWAALPGVDEHGMRLRQVAEIKSPTIKRLFAKHGARA